MVLRDSPLYLFCGFVGKNTCRCTHHNKQPISTKGLTSETAIAIAFTWCVALIRVPGTFKKKERCSVIHRVYCSCKYSEIQRSKNLKFQYQATQKNFLCTVYIHVYIFLLYSVYIPVYFLIVYIYKLYSTYIVSHIFVYNLEKFPPKIPKYVHQIVIFTYIKWNRNTKKTE